MDREHYKSNLISILLECVFYGIFLTLFIVSTSLLALRWRRSKHSTLPAEKRLRFSLLVYLSLGSTMFLCLTGVLVLSWMRFLSPDSLSTTTQSGLFLYFGVGDVSITPAIFGRAVLFVTTSNLSDVILTYRLWVIFGGSRRVMVAPYLMWLGFFRLMIVYITHGTISLPWLLSLVALSIGLNFYFTASVFYHFRKTQKAASYGGASTAKGLAIVIESAAGYTAWLLLFVITTLAHAEDLAGLFADGIAFVSGIFTLLVNVRVGLGWAWVNLSTLTPPPPNSPGTVLDFQRWCSNVTLTSGVMDSERHG